MRSGWAAADTAALWGWLDGLAVCVCGLTSHQSPSSFPALPCPAAFAVRSETVQVGPTRHEVTAILALYGLPRLLTGCILAHECTHAYL